MRRRHAGLTITTPQPDDWNRNQTPSDVRPPTTGDMVGLGLPFPNAPCMCAVISGGHCSASAGWSTHWLGPSESYGLLVIRNCVTLMV
jgi:hypothetical protein